MPRASAAARNLGIDGRQREALPDRQLEIGRIVEGQTVRVGKAERIVPGVIRGCVVKDDRQGCQITERGVPEMPVDPPPTDGHGEGVGHLERPMRSRKGFKLSEFLLDFVGLGRVLVRQAP